MKASEIAEKLFKIEEELNLFDKKIQGIYFWKLIRFDIYQEMLLELKLINKNNSNKNSVLKKISRITSNLKNTILYSTNSAYKDFIILENPRKIKDEFLNYYDLYTKYFVDEQIKNNMNFEIIDLGNSGIHYEKSNDIRKFADNFFYDVIKKFFLKNSFLDNNERIIIRNIENQIDKNFNLNIKLENIIIKNINLFKLDYEKFSSLFKKKRNKKLYLVCSYGKEGIIKAAQDLNIEVIEFQHGTMTKYHVGYAFPNNLKISYFPNKMLLFGKFWSDSTPLPLDNDSLKYIGFQDFNKKVKLYKNIKKEDKITFISQWTISEKIFKKAIETAINYPNYKIVYRLHPSEKHLEKHYSKFIKKQNILNIKLGNIEKPILEELSDSRYVIGVYSTGIYEALSLGCKVLLLDLYGIEYMEYLIRNNYAKKINLERKICLDNINLKISSSEYFFGV